MAWDGLSGCDPHQVLHRWSAATGDDGGPIAVHLQASTEMSQSTNCAIGVAPIHRHEAMRSLFTLVLEHA